MNKMEIPRGKWLTGALLERRGYSCLLNETGEQCCLGFLATHLGAANESILEVPAPSDIMGYIDFPDIMFDKSSSFISNYADFKFGGFRNQDWESVLIDINDDKNIESSLEVINERDISWRPSNGMGS